MTMQSGNSPIHMSDMPQPEASRWRNQTAREQLVLEGHYARLELLNAERHAGDLFALLFIPGADRITSDGQVPSLETFYHWLAAKAASADAISFAVIDKSSNRVEGRQTLARQDITNGVIEAENMVLGPGITRARVLTEAFYLCACHAFETLGCLRLEWTCDDMGKPARLAILDSNWPRLKAGYEKWLSPKNFDSTGRQKQRLSF